MKTRTAAGLAFVLSSACTIVWLWWPRAAPGWFELDGRPVAIDGRPVEDWRHANDVLASSAPAVVATHLAHRQSRHPPAELFDREFTIDYEPRGATGSVRVRVRRYQPITVVYGGRAHPAASARYEIVGAPTSKD